MQSGPPKERATAGWALARSKADRENWRGAYRAIQIFHDHPEGTDVIPHPGPFLLAVMLGLRCNDIIGAERILKAAERRFGRLPDLEFAAMTCAKARGHDDWELSSYLSRIFLPQGLAAVTLADGPDSRLDQLSAQTYSREGGTSEPLVSAVMPVFNGADTPHTAQGSAQMCLGPPSQRCPGRAQEGQRKAGADLPNGGGAIGADDLKAQANRFIVASEPVADWLGCPDRTRIRPNSVDEALFDLPFAPQSPLWVALISINIAKKGVADFIAAARLVQAAGRDVRFLLIGPPTQGLHLLLPLPENVEFRGYAATPPEAVSQTDVVLSLSRFAESFGRTVREAMAAGRPVICYDKGAPPSLVQSGRSGFVVPDDRQQGVASAVLSLDAARGQLARMSESARLSCNGIRISSLTAASCMAVRW